MEKEPIKKLLERMKEKSKPKYVPLNEKSHEDVILSLILAAFILGALITANVDYTAYVIEEKQLSEAYNISTLFMESANLSIAFPGNITSLKITGEFIGDGTAIIWLSGKKVVELNNNHAGNLITANAISEIAENAASEENISIGENKTFEENFTLNVNISAQNDSLANDFSITESNDINSSDISEAIEKVSPVNEYCLETCTLDNLPSNITLNIELHNLSLNLSHISVTYIENENINIIFPPNTTENNSIDIPNFNLPENASIIEANVTAIIENEPLNISASNITEYLNETIEGDNSTILPVKNITEQAVVNFTPETDSIKLLDLSEQPGGLLIKKGIDNQNFISALLPDPDDLIIEINSVNDTRLLSKFIRIEYNESLPEITVSLQAENASVVLKCIQEMDNFCKRWQKTDIEISENNGTATFIVVEQGVYSLAGNEIIQKEYIAATSVYRNSDCDKCSRIYDCDAKISCVSQNRLPDHETETSQFDFDIYNLDQAFTSVEVCSYISYNSEGPVINYVKYGPESFCSDIRNGNLTSDLISYKLIEGKDTWACIDVTDIVKKAMGSGFSNVFINWLGQDAQGSNKPITCLLGKTPLDKCQGYNPSGANDCRPYLKLNYG